MAAYLDTAAERAALADLPLEARLRGVPEERVIARLVAERGQALARPARSQPVLGAFLLVERMPDPALAGSLASLALQSDPSTTCTLLLTPGVDRAMLDVFLDEQVIAPRILVSSHDDPDRRARLRACRYATFLRHGDRLNPSATAWLAAGLAHPTPPDVTAWCEYQPGAAGRPAWLQRNPALNRISLLHFPYLRNAFAVSGARAADYPGDLSAEALDNELHLFHLWLLRQPNLNWAAHPEFFLVRADSRAHQTPLEAARRAYRNRSTDYAAAFATSDEFDLSPNPEGAVQPYRLVPRRTPDKISVIIPFRDRPELTLGALASVAAQSAASKTEILLIDNQSSDETVRQIRTGCEALRLEANCRILPYGHAFNHSAQCNLGVRESRGDVVVFMNNDCTLIANNALEEMAAWALLPGIATVGAAILEPDREVPAAGFQARLLPAYYFDSIVVERSEPELAPFVRETAGNTFALAAASRAALTAIGPLDEDRFPNGFNDVEFSCRALRQGFKHVALGHVTARHVRGASRARADENAQVVLLRTLYPEAAAGALDELRFDEVLALAGGPRRTSAGPLPTPPRWWLASQVEPPSLLKRIAGRVARSPWAQRILANPRAYELIRRTYKLISP